MKTAAALLLLAALANAVKAHGADPTHLPVGSVTVQHVEVRGPRIHANDLLTRRTGSTKKEGTKESQDVDLGPSPVIGASRLIERAEIERAYVNAGATPPSRSTIPASVRITRKTRRLAAAEVVTAIRTALAQNPLPRGASIASVRAPLSTTDVADDFHHVSVELPSLPRRSGPVTVQAIVTFLGEGDVALHKTIVPIELALPSTAALPEIPRGSPITLLVRHGLVEVSVGGVAATDADVGAILPVTIKPSGRVLRARAIDKDHAVALEDS